MARKKMEVEVNEIAFVARHGDADRAWNDAVDRAKAERDEGWLGHWLTSRGIDARMLSDEDLCRKAVEFYNDTLRPGDKPRTFVRLGETK